MAAASVPRGVILTLILCAMPSRGKTSSIRKIPLVLPQDRDHFRVQYDLLEGFDGADIGFRGLYLVFDGRSLARSCRSRCNSVRGDQFREILPAEDHRIDRYTTGELSRDSPFPATNPSRW
ncbi:MAG: hypothetical protein R3F36_11965 [Candidatus Competibacteraceae bacterium]